MTTETPKSKSRAIRLPGFLNENEIGMGDAIKRATSYLGVAPCGAARPRRGVEPLVRVSGNSRSQRSSSSTK